MFPRKVFNSTWYSGKGTQETLLETIKENERLMTCVVDNRHHWKVIKENEVIPLINNNNGFICEVLSSYPKKLYFDVDCDTPNDLSLDKVKEVIKKYFGDAKMAVSGYENENKKSYHITLYEYVISNEKELLEMRKIVNYINKTECPYFDWKVYTKNRPMKCINQSKPEKPKQMIISDTNQKNHLIMSFFSGNEKLFNFHLSEDIPQEETNVKEIINVKPIKLNQDFKPEDLNDSKKLLMMLPNSKEIPHSITWKVALFCQNNGLSFDDFWAWAKIKQDDEERRLKWVSHWNKIVGQLDYKMTKKSFILLLSFWYPELKEVERASDAITKKFIDTLTIPSIEIERIEKNHFLTSNKVVIFNIGMGGGKTTMTVDYLKSSEKKFIWLTPRQALVMNTNQRFVDNKMNVVNYLNCGSSREQKSKKINSASSLILECESLNYLEKTTQFDVLVIDEIETVIKNWDSETHDKNGDKNFNNFVSLFKNCKKIILLDAFTTSTTLKFLEMVGIKDVITYSSKYKPAEKILNDNYGYDKTISKIADELDNGKKLYVFHAYKSSTKKHYSIEELKSELLERCKTKPKILVYHGDMSDDKKKTLYNVNEEWDKYDCILTTSSITVGVNYEGDRYDKVYLLVSGCVNNVRDVIQTSMRIRKTKENIIEMFFFDRMEKSLLKYPKWYNGLDDVYKFLVDSALEEKQSNFMDVFYEFCKMTNYNIGNVKKIVKNKLEKFNNDLHESKMLISYDDIPTISEDVAKEIEKEAVWVCRASQLDKFTLSKFYFDCHFYHMDNEDRAFIWDNRCRNFFDNYDCEIIKKIIKDNKIKHISELNLNDLVISNDTNNYIKNNYASTIKNINQRLIKVINLVLGCQVIESVSKSAKSKATKYEFTELYNALDEINKKYKNPFDNNAFLD
jgi:hypothetical protein